MRISDWSSDVCSSDLHQPRANGAEGVAALTLVPGAASLDLVFTLGHIVDDTVAGYMLQSVFQGNIAGLGAYDHAQLDFPIGLDRPFGQIGRASCRERVCQYV